MGIKVQTVVFVNIVGDGVTTAFEIDLRRHPIQNTSGFDFVKYPPDSVDPGASLSAASINGQVISVTLASAVVGTATVGVFLNWSV